MNEATESFRTVLTVLWALNILLEIAFIGAAFYRFRASVAGLLLGGSYALMVIVSTISRLVRWLAPSVASLDSSSGMLMTLTTSFLQWILLIVLGVGILLIPTSIDKLAKSRVTSP